MIANGAPDEGASPQRNAVDEDLDQKAEEERR